MFKYFTLKEVLASCANYEIIQSIRDCSLDRLLCLVMVLDAFRVEIETPIKINSSYRDVRHNADVGGSPTSQHCLGEAIDFCCPRAKNNITIALLRKFLKVSPLSVYIGQVIFYDTFIHIALRTEKHNKVTYYDKRTSKKSN